MCGGQKVANANDWSVKVFQKSSPKLRKHKTENSENILKSHELSLNWNVEYRDLKAVN